MPLAQEVSEKYEIQCSNIKEAHLWDNFFKFAATSKLITPSLLARDNFDMVNSVLKKLQAKSADILNVSSSLAKAFDGDVYKLDGAAYHKKLTKQFIGKASRIFSSEYKHIVKELRFCKKDGRKPSYREAVDTMGKLAQYQQKCAEFSELESKIKTYLGKCYVGIDTDWDNVLKQMDELNVIISYPLRLGKLEKYDSFDFEQQAFAEYHKNFESIFKSCSDDILNQIAGYFDLHILDIKLTPSLLVEKRLENCLAEMNKLENWCHFMTLLSKLNDKQVVPYIRAVIAQNIEAKDIVGAFKKQFYYQWIYSILSENQVLSSFDRIRQDNVRKTFAEKDIEQFEINKAKIRERLSSLRPSLDMVAQGSPLSILLREGGKKRKQKSIRHLLSETGELVQRIKPCFLMSPLSVSTFLASDSIHFDTVIFDEASQIFPQDAIGAIYRADQLIVVGDSKQMPPSNFFNTTIESDDEETDDVTSFESILDLCSASMQQHRLCWHYRSRYEQLIAFSNKNFYDNDLITFPSSKAKDFGIGIDYYHVDGVFDRKAHVNRKEAEFIVDLIYRNIEEYPERSLGVVAFSIAQQDLIDKLLSKRRQETPEKEFFFRKDNREAFFIKNLETVQGDERDTIIFSIAYGVDSQGRFSHNFGPLNRLGGERRLNVAVTRAKINLQVVSSMHYTNIDLAKTSADGAKLLREYLDYAENGNIALERSLSVNKFEQFDSDFELEVCEFLKGRGFSVDTQVGCSGFRIDIGLKRPNSSDYVLAIECDGATYHSAKNARDRDRLRQDILERMGWKFYRIWSTDWFRNKAVEQQRLFDAAVKAVTNTEREEVLQKNSPSAEPFENIMPEKHFEFPVYKFADIDILSKQYSQDFKGMIKAILEIEAPLSEEFLLKRIAPLFGREKVTNFVYEIYKQKMFGYQCYDIIRENGFLYLKNGKDIQFRCAGDDGKRDIKQIAPEELAAGMFEILKQNVSADKNGLYHDLAIQCGVTRTGKAINETMDSALNLLIRKGKVILDDGRISIR